MYASEEGAATSTEPAVGGEEEAAEGQPVQASAPKPKVPAGPMMQPEEDKRRAKEEKELSEKPKGNPWASNVFKRGVVLQVQYVFVSNVCALHVKMHVFVGFVTSHGFVRCGSGRGGGECGILLCV